MAWYEREREHQFYFAYGLMWRGMVPLVNNHIVCTWWAGGALRFSARLHHRPPCNSPPTSAFHLLHSLTMRVAMVSLFPSSETITLFFGFDGGRGGALNGLALACIAAPQLSESGTWRTNREFGVRTGGSAYIICYHTQYEPKHHKRLKSYEAVPRPHSSRGT